jgi:hypothetical protein
MSSRQDRKSRARKPVYLFGSAVANVLSTAVDSVAKIALTSEQRVFTDIERELLFTGTLYSDEFDAIEASIDRLTAQQKESLRLQLETSVNILPRLVFPKPHLRLAQFLWRTLKVRLPGLIFTSLALNTGPLKLNHIGRQVKADGHQRLNSIKRAVANHNAVIDEREAWAALLAAQGFGADVAGPNQSVYDNLYKHDSDVFTQHWLMRQYGNFPVSIDADGTVTRILELWPRSDGNKVAVYGMYPSLDPDKAFITAVLNDGIFNFNAALKHLIELGAQDWNVKRVVSLGISNEQLKFVDRNLLTNLCLLWGNTAVLRAIDYQPIKVNLKDPESVDSAAFKLTSIRRDMWPYMVSKDAAEEVIPLAMNILNAIYP